MGGSSSKVKQLNHSITNVTTEIVARTSTVASGSIKSTQNLVFSGTASNVEILQSSAVDLDILQKSDINADMQTEIVNSILNEVSKIKTDFPQIPKSKSDTEITNIIENNVSNTFSQESLAELRMGVEQDQNVMFTSGSMSENIKIAQTADAVGKLINSMSGNIIVDLAAGTELENQAKEETKFFVSDAIDSTGGVIESAGQAASGVIEAVGDVFGLDISTMIMIVAVVFIGYLATRSRGKTKSDVARAQMQAQYAQQYNQQYTQQPQYNPYVVENPGASYPSSVMMPQAVY
jgi:hypothetical protein